MVKLYFFELKSIDDCHVIVHYNRRTDTIFARQTLIFDVLFALHKEGDVTEIFTFCTQTAESSCIVHNIRSQRTTNYLNASKQVILNYFRPVHIAVKTNYYTLIFIPTTYVAVKKRR